MDGSDIVVPLKIASACLWRSGEDGAVNWNTIGAIELDLYESIYSTRCLPAGPVSATLRHSHQQDIFHLKAK